MTETESVTLLEVNKDGEILVLLDGRKLWVTPGDMPTACIWIPTAELGITENAVGDTAFPLVIHNKENGEEIRATWKD